MSVLAVPRLYFQGYTSWDPNVTNNDPAIWDPVNVNVVLPQGVEPDTYQQYVIDNASTLGDWNIYGSHACDFVQFQSFTTTITGGTTGSGLITSDPVVGQPLSMPGRLVDLDPSGVDTSQFFFDQLSIGSSGGPSITAPRAQRMHSRWINFFRNLNTGGDPRIQIAGIAAVVWQTTFPTASLQLNGAGSQLLSAFSYALQQPGVLGLMVRFTVYRTLYFQNGVFNDISQTPQTEAELQALYQQGQMFSNPAYSVATGVVGLWMGNEVPSVPGGRYLLPTTASQGKRTGLGPAVAELNGNVLSLDFGSAIPEVDFDLNKRSFGKLTVSAGGTAVATIDVTGYDKAAYQANGGIIDLKIDNPAAMSGLISVSGTLDGAPIAMFQESEFSAQTDTKNMYLDENGELTVSVYVAQKGQPAPQGTQVDVAQYAESENNPMPFQTLTVGANGLATFSVQAVQPGYVYYRFAPYKAGSTPPKPPRSLNSMTDFYCGVRTLPFDDELNRNTPDSALTWAWVYANILQPFNLCPAAAMLAIGIPLSDQSIWETPQMAANIQARTAASNFESTGYMPVTRELSNGMRELLDRWANLVISGTLPAAAEEEVALVNRPRRRLIREAV